ncbi:MAG: hypothetical protein KDK25_08970 [Leptospiraceae bacterium]|nr:hypothetical protein [Leptospiraceae bacterium]
MRSFLRLSVLLFSLSLFFSGCSGAGEKPGAATPEKGADLPVSDLVLSHQKDDPIWNDSARIIAGLDGADASHKKAMDRLWKRIQSQNIDPIQEWISDKPYLKESRRPVFYPLSGADFINAHTFFPRAPFYLLVATEPPGNPAEVRNLKNGVGEKGLAAIRSVITNISGENYFQSAKMSHTMRNPELSGVLPVLLVWLARKDQEVLSVQSVSIAKSGEIVEQGGVHPGLRIRFRPLATDAEKKDLPGAVQTLYYFKIFLGAKSLEAAGGQPESPLLGNLQDVNTIMKAAVYLLHNEKYAPLARSILARSKLILQDDSGIPYRMFSADWQVDLYGNYTTPVALRGMLDPYDHLKQPALTRAFKKDSHGPLPFPYSYGILRSGMKESMLMLARKKD